MRNAVNDVSRDATMVTGEEAATSSEKALRVLLAFEERAQWSLNELSKRLNLPNSTVHRLLTALKKYQFVQQESPNGKYFLGFRVWSISQQLRNYEFIRIIVQPVLEELVRATGETAFVTVRSGLHALCIARVDTPQGVRLLIDVGTASPLHLGASNTVLLAFMSSRERAAVLKATVPDPKTRSAVEDEMRVIAKMGYAYSSEQLTPGAAAVGVPVFDNQNRLVAALSIGAPAYRLKRKEALDMLPALRNAALALKEDLHRTPASPVVSDGARRPRVEGGGA